jgi:diguanylate cyclase (GGDEF)-like protein/PAS domain S-box-containing protein
MDLDGHVFHAFGYLRQQSPSFVSPVEGRSTCWLCTWRRAGELERSMGRRPGSVMSAAGPDDPGAGILIASTAGRPQGPGAGSVGRRVPVIAGVCVMVLGALVLAGWALGSGLLKSVAPGLPTMKANTAVALVCAGAAVLCLAPGTPLITRRIGRLLALLVAAFGALVLWEYLVGGVGFDQALFRDGAPAFPGRPSAEAAVALVALGLALATVDGRGRRRGRVHFVLLGILATVVLFGVVGDIYGVHFLRGSSQAGEIAVHTLLALVLLTVAIAFLRVRDGVAVWLRGNGSAARMARALLPVVVVGPLILGGLRFEAEELGWIGLRIGLSLFTLSMILMLVTVVAVVGHRLRTSELELRRLAAIVDASDDAIINKTAEGVILSWNAAAERMYGDTADEVIGRPVSILAPPERADEIDSLLERVRDGEVQRIETERVHRDGTRLSVALTVSPMRDETGRVVGASTTARDITVRNDSERQLEHTSRLLAEAQAIAGLGSWERDADGGSTTWTDQIYEIFGVDRQRVGAADATAFRQLVDADDLAGYEATLQAVHATGTPGVAVFRIRRPDGQQRVLETHARVVERDGRERLVGTVMDITEPRRLQEQLTAARDLFAGVLDAATETAIIGTDPEGLITVFNRGAERMLGRHAAEMVGHETPALFHDPAEIVARASELGIEPGFEVFAAGPRAGGSETREWSYIHADGHRLTVSLTATAVHGEGGEVKGFIGVASDVTEFRHAEAARHQAERRFEAAFEHAPIGVALVGLRGPERGRCLHANETFARLVGRGPGELDGMAFDDLTHPDDRPDTADYLARLDRRESVATEKRYLHRDGRAISVLVSATPILDETTGEPSYCVSQVLDLSERKRFESELRHLADHDTLTGLYNRQRFESELGRVVDESRRYNRTFALLALDLDGFKAVNDTFGHPVGDELIARIGSLLRQTVRDTDIIARVGGDEFAVIVHEADELAAATVAEKILEAIRLGGLVEHGARQTRVMGSIGITTVDGNSHLTDDELVIEADTAMYDAKSEGRDRYAVHDRTASPRRRVSTSRSWLQRLRHAIDDDRFVLHAQPIVGICAQGIPRYELLIRMLGDDGELIPPSAFIYNAERFDLIGRIDRWVLGSAVKLLHDHTVAGNDLAIAVNLSGKTMNDLNLAEDLALMIAANPIPSGRLIVEVTETAAIVNIERARDLAAQLRTLGCRFALDDFGAGFASFYYLKHLDFDYLKIDGEFITKLINSKTDQLIVKALVGIAHGLGTETVAEFVNDEATLELLHELGVDYGQGYHLGTPGPIGKRLPALPKPVRTPRAKTAARVLAASAGEQTSSNSAGD